MPHSNITLAELLAIIFLLLLTAYTFYTLALEHNQQTLDAYSRGFIDGNSKLVHESYAQGLHDAVNGDARALKVEMEACRRELSETKAELQEMEDRRKGIVKARNEIGVQLDAFKYSMDDWMELRRGEIRRLCEEVGVEVELKKGEGSVFGQAPKYEEVVKESGGERAKERKISLFWGGKNVSRKD